MDDTPKNSQLECVCVIYSHDFMNYELESILLLLKKKEEVSLSLNINH